jgi:hypothetical protein
MPKAAPSIPAELIGPLAASRGYFLKELLKLPPLQRHAFVKIAGQFHLRADSMVMVADGKIPFHGLPPFWPVQFLTSESRGPNEKPCPKANGCLGYNNIHKQHSSISNKGFRKTFVVEMKQ